MKEEVPTIQIMLLGDFCGKTSLMKKYVSGTFKKEYESTFGKLYIKSNNISFKNIYLKVFALKKRKFNLTIINIM
jgi:GTPase SAR1 family protein